MADKVKTSMDKFAADLNSILTQYSEDINKDVEDAAKAIGNKGKNAIKRNARAMLKKYGGQRKYSNGWQLKKTVRKKTGNTEYVIFNKSAPGLAHLLEFGHATRNGGRTRAFAHIQPVSDEIQNTFVDEVKKRIALKGISKK